MYVRQKYVFSDEYMVIGGDITYSAIHHEPHLYCRVDGEDDEAVASRISVAERTGKRDE